MSKRRTKAEQIATLKAAHERDLLHASARSAVDEMKTLLHKRAYGAALQANERQHADLIALCKHPMSAASAAQLPLDEGAP